VPWYRGFSGSVEIIDRRQKHSQSKSSSPILSPSPILSLSANSSPSTLNSSACNSPSVESSSYKSSKGKEPVDVDDEQVEDQKESTYVNLERFEDVGDRPLYSLVTRGDFYRDKKGQVVITELPIGRWIHPYRKWLEKMRESKHLKDFRDCSSANMKAFEIRGLKHVPSHRYLRLITQYGMSNMRLLDEFGKPKRYDGVADILEDFYHRRLGYYDQRKDYILGEWESKCAKLREKKRFLEAYNDGLIIIDRTRTLEEVHADMDRMNFDRGLLSKTHLGKLPRDSLQQLENKIQQLEADIKVLSQTSSSSIWLQELEDFEAEYCKRYKIPRKGQKLKAPH
jgi:hypothetical protein